MCFRKTAQRYVFKTIYFSLLEITKISVSHLQKKCFKPLSNKLLLISKIEASYMLKNEFIFAYKLLLKMNIL